MKKKIVISAINIYYGGTLSIVKEVLAWLSEHANSEYEIIALVHDKKLYPYSNISYLEFPDSRNSWFKRLFYEFYYFKRLSQKIEPYLWFSLHDISPVVKADVKAVYCHNPSPFYKISLKEALQDKVFAAFTIFYKYLYKLNIRSNNFIVVQQDWIREYFKKEFAVPHEKIVVAYPCVVPLQTAPLKQISSSPKKTFFYPSFPRVFKNFEAICEAVKILRLRSITNFEVILTTDATETPYAKQALSKYKEISEIKFIGSLSREEVEYYYNISDCFIFPSKLETWGLPITEFKRQGKPMLLANLPYARETLGNYEKAAFFDPKSPISLADLMQGVIDNSLQYQEVQAKQVPAPFTQDWTELFQLLLNKSQV